MPARHTTGLVLVDDVFAAPAAPSRFPTAADYAEDYDSAQARAVECFDLVANADDWKAPIDAWIDEADLATASDAVAFFTATELDVVAEADGRVRVRSVGYRNGPAA